MPNTTSKDEVTCPRCGGGPLDVQYSYDPPEPRTHDYPGSTLTITDINTVGVCPGRCDIHLNVPTDEELKDIEEQLYEILDERKRAVEEEAYRRQYEDYL